MKPVEEEIGVNHIIFGIILRAHYCTYGVEENGRV